MLKKYSLLLSCVFFILLVPGVFAQESESVPNETSETPPIYLVIITIIAIIIAIYVTLFFVTRVLFAALPPAGDNSGTSSAPTKSDKNPVIETAPPISLPPGTIPNCTIDVRAVKLKQLNRRGPIYHLFIVYTDQNKKEWFFSGYPTNYPSILRSIVPFLGAAIGLALKPFIFFSGPALGGRIAYKLFVKFGPIIVKTGPHVQGISEDWTQIKPLTRVVLTGPAACATYQGLLTETLRINTTKTEYKLLGPNSNSVAYTLLFNNGITPVHPAPKNIISVRGWGKII